MITSNIQKSRIKKDTSQRSDKSSMLKGFAKLKFKNNVLIEHGLPDIEYPIPTEKFPLVVETGGKIFPEVLIYWIMEYISGGPEDREIYEINLLKIAEEFAPSTGKSEYTYKSRKVVKDPDDFYENHYAKWTIRLQTVDLSKPLVTVQNKRSKDTVLGAFSYHKETYNLQVCLYTGPSLNVIEYIRTYGKDNYTDTRKFNSFSQMVGKTKKWSSFYLQDENQDYLCNWEYGLGWKNLDLFDEDYQKSLNLNPIPSDWVLFFIKIVEVVEKNSKLRYMAGLSLH